MMNNSKKKKRKSNNFSRTDRCMNPFGNPNHIGKGLRKISKKVSLLFPHLPRNSTICYDCRRLCDQRELSQSSYRTLNTSSLDDNESVADESPNKKKCL